MITSYYRSPNVAVMAAMHGANQRRLAKEGLVNLTEVVGIVIPLDPVCFHYTKVELWNSRSSYYGFTASVEF